MANAAVDAPCPDETLEIPKLRLAGKFPEQDSGASDLTTDTDSSGSSSPTPVSVYSDSERSTSHSESEAEDKLARSRSTSESGYGGEESTPEQTVSKRKPRTRRFSRPQRTHSSHDARFRFRASYRYHRSVPLLEVPSEALTPGGVSILGRNNCLDPVYRLGWVEWAHSRARLHWAQFTGRMANAEATREQERKQVTHRRYKSELEFKWCESRYQASGRISPAACGCDGRLSSLRTGSCTESLQESHSFELTFLSSPSSVGFRSDSGDALTDVEDCIHDAPRLLFELKSPIHQSSMHETHPGHETPEEQAERRAIISRLEKDFIRIGTQLQRHLSHSTAVIRQKTASLDQDSDDEQTRNRYYALMAAVKEQYGSAKLVRDLKQEHARLLEQQVGELAAIQGAATRKPEDRSTRLAREAQAKLRMRSDLDKLREDFRRSATKELSAQNTEIVHAESPRLVSGLSESKDETFSSPNSSYSKVQTQTAIRKLLATESVWESP